MRWQRAVDAALRPLDLTHTQYLVLASTADAIEDNEQDAVAQLAIAEKAGLDAATVSTLVRKLEERGFVDRGPDGVDSRRWRVILTGSGKKALNKATLLVEAAAASLPRRSAAR
jgi:DNA-binding MarR family transcriptional regulator